MKAAGMSIGQKSANEWQSVNSQESSESAG